MTQAEWGAEAKRRLEDLVSFFGINAEAAVMDGPDGLVVELPAAPYTPRLIGHRGETLRALEYLTNQMLKAQADDAPRVAVDAGGYRQARREALEVLAREAAQRVVASGQEEELEPMNPAERRIVHMALREVPGIRTESRGESRSRRTVILPDRAI